MLHLSFLVWCSFHLALCLSQVHGSSARPWASVHKAEVATQREVCPVSVCFGLESSRALNAYQFDKQKRFFTLLLENLSKRRGVKVAAVQYSSANEVLFELTADVEEAIEKVSRFSQSDDRFSSPSSPIVYCDSVLREDDREKASLVLFSTGQQDLGGEPVMRADVFRERSEGEVTVIGVGNRNFEVLRAIAGDGYLFSLFFEDRSGSADRVADAICRSG